MGLAHRLVGIAAGEDRAVKSPNISQIYFEKSSKEKGVNTQTSNIGLGEGEYRSLTKLGFGDSFAGGDSIAGCQRGGGGKLSRG